jgi:HK97 family phage portal protein
MAGLFGNLARIVARRETTPQRDSGRRDHFVTYGRADTAGIWMTHDEALRLSAVWACVTVIAKAIASSEWEVFAEAENGDRTAQKSTITWRLLNLRPNSEMIPFAWREAMVIMALVYGDAFSEIERDMAARPYALWPLSPDRSSLDRDRAGQLVVNVAQAEGGNVSLPYTDVFHLHGPSIDGIAGFDLVRLAARSLALAAAAERFGGAFFANNATFGGVLSSEQKLGPEKIAEMQAQIAKGHSRDKAWTWMVVDSGLTVSSISTEPEKAQMVEARYLQIEEVCRWFGVPPHKIAHLLRSTNNNIEAQGIEFERDAIVPWCERLRQEADWKLIPGTGRFLRTRLNTDWLSAGDAKTRAETDNILVTGGIMLRNEARRKRNWNSLGPMGDVPTVNPGTTALKEALKPKAAPPKPGGDPNLDPAADPAANPPAPQPPAGRRTRGAA